jgi:hypothetical protein
LANIEQIRDASPSKGSIVHLGDGELRGGGYCLLPPSTHPNGHQYRFSIPLNRRIPALDLVEAGFLTADVTESTEDNGDNGGVLRQQKPLRGESQSDSKTILTASTDIPEAIEQAIIESLPTGPGRRNKQVFELARGLKAIPALADIPKEDLKDLKRAVRRWHELARPVIRTQPFEETWIDFIQAWPKVRFPKGAEPMAQVIARVIEADIPDVAQSYEQSELRRLVAICRELQRATGGGPFYLSARTAGRLLEVSPMTAWRWLFLLESDGILATVTKGTAKTQKATRFRYLAAK